MRVVLRAGRVLAGVLAGLGLAFGDAAGIIVPSAEYSTIPARAVLAGLGTSGPDESLGSFVVLVRDNYARPLPHSAVACELSEGSDFRFAASPPDPQVVVQCGERMVWKFTDIDGVVRFTLLGGGRSPQGAPAAANRLRIHADGVTLGLVPVTCHDMDGMHGVDAADLSCWARDFFAQTHPNRADFDADGAVTLVDLARWAGVYFGGTSAQSPPAYCP